MDNEDPGFRVVKAKGFNIVSLFKGEEENPKEYRRYSMEDAWIPSIDERFYGFPVRSAFCKQAGAGKQKVEWNTTLPQDGNYEVFFYYTARFTGSSSAQKEESHYYTVFDGQEEHEVIVDINTDEVGNWISLGVFDFSKNAKVTLSDRARTGDNAQPLVADAVKWVKR